MAPITPQSLGNATAGRLCEQRVREWTLHVEAQRRRRAAEVARVEPGHIHPYVAISREAGAGGAALARLVGEKLNWEVLHRELLDTMADRFNLPRALLGVIDESASNWMVEVFGKWLDPLLVTRTEYIMHLGQIVLLAAQHASKVFVGRGAQFFLPPDRGVTIFLVAPLAMRIQRLKEVRGLSEQQARRYIRDTDQGRRELIKAHFNRDIGDPHAYDLVINRAHTSLEAAADLIVSQCGVRFGIH
jgi:cytidylate kinase